MAYLGNTLLVGPVRGTDIVDGTVMAADMKAGEITATMVGAYTKAETDAAMVASRTTAVNDGLILTLALS
jgi:hypothetical protein